ncbi:MAG: polysaccharide ABC transporter ATP-binding protein, partial [Culicoidibacterales bacterium]
ITGVAYPNSGEIKVHGKISSLLELGTGFNMDLSGMENIYFQGDLAGIKREEMEARIDTILEFADIGEFIHQPVKNYSSGMFARLAFSVAINIEPDILIVDEILSVGDALFQLKCIEKIKEFSRKGVTILFVTHNIMSLAGFCDRAVWLDGGKVRQIGEVDPVVQQYLIAVGTSGESEGVIGGDVMHFDSIDFFGQDPLKLTTDDDIHFKVRIESMMPVDKARVYVGIKMSGIELRDTISYRNIYDIDGGFELTICIPKHSLNTGEYSVVVGVSDEKTIQHFVMGVVAKLQIKNSNPKFANQEGMLLTDMTVEVVK